MLNYRKKEKTPEEKVLNFIYGLMGLIVLIGCVFALQSCASESAKPKNTVLTAQDKQYMMICDNRIKNVQETFKTENYADVSNDYEMYDRISQNIINLKKIRTNFANKISVEATKNEYNDKLLTTYAQLGLIQKMLEEPSTYSNIKVRNAMEVINGQIQEAQQSYNKLKAEGVSIAGKEGEVKNGNKEQQ